MADKDNTPLKPSEQPFEALPVPKGACSLSFLKVWSAVVSLFYDHALTASVSMHRNIYKLGHALVTHLVSVAVLRHT